MSKRNFILIVIILVIVIAVVFGFFYFYQPANKTDTTEGTNFFANFLPFGKSKTTTPVDTNQPIDISGYVPPAETDISTLKLKKISNFPIAGYGIFMKEKELGIFSPALRYVNKATGNIYQTFADRIDERKFSSTVVPKVYEAFFGNEGESVVMRYLKGDNKTIETFIGILQKEYLGADSIGTNEVTGSFLPENISDISVSPDASKIFYLFNIGDNTAGVTYSLETKTKTQVFDSPFTEWLSFWPNNKMITITTKPSFGVPGYMYAINPDNKNFNKILGGINGLTTLASPNGKMILYADNNLSLNIFNTETRNSNLLGVKTLPEKCVWGTASDIVYCAVPKFIDRAQYPDSWYQGEISFSDEIWKIDVISGNTTMILDPTSVENGPASPSQGGEEIDGIKFNLDEGQNYLLFVNKKDSYLWELSLK
jgi:hypothetical protein